MSFVRNLLSSGNFGGAILRYCSISLWLSDRLSSWPRNWCFDSRGFLRNNRVEVYQPLINLLKSRIDVFDVRFALNYLIANQVHHYFGHTTWGSIPGPLENNV